MKWVCAKGVHPYLRIDLFGCGGLDVGGVKWRIRDSHPGNSYKFSRYFLILNKCKKKRLCKFNPGNKPVHHTPVHHESYIEIENPKLLASTAAMEEKDAYAPLATAIRRVKEPLQKLVQAHDQFVLRNLAMVNNVKSLREVRRSAQRGLLATGGDGSSSQ